MPVVTISREFGSHGSLVAEKAAHALGYRLADKSTIESIFRDYGLPRLEAEYQSVPGFWDRFDLQRRDRRETLFTMLNQSLRALARHGNLVVVGRGGFAVLAGLADVLNVRVQAPVDLRIKRVAEASSAAERERAEEVVRANDHLQKTFIEAVYGVAWDSAVAFDLVLDTGKIPVEAAAGMIVQAVASLPAPGTPGLRTTSGLQVDRILASAVEEAVGTKEAHLV
jgi:cytidylate kinase